jgi:lipopolysaccharide export system protein LptA
MSWPIRNRTKVSQPVKNRSLLAITFCIAITGALAAQPSPKPTPKPKQIKNSTARNTATPTPVTRSSPGVKNEKKQDDLLGGSNQNKGPTEITSQETQFDGQSRTGVFIGSVKVIDPDFTMTTDKLTVHMAKQEEGGGLSSAEAEGNVIIVHANEAKNTKSGSDAGAPATPVPSPTPTVSSVLADPPSASPIPSPTPPVLSTGRAQKALYDAKDQSVTLIGWPQITQGVNTHISTEEGTRMILYRDGRLKTYGGSRTIIQDKSEANKTVPPKQ